MRIAFFILAYTVIIATLLPLIPSALWWVRMMEFPRFQLVLIGMAAFTIFYFVRIPDIHIKILALLLASAMIFQSVKIFPYTFFSGKEVMETNSWTEDNCLSLVIANVLMDNTNSAKFLEIIDKVNPDVILAVETNSWWIEQLEGLMKEYPHHEFAALENTYGMALFSRFKLKNLKVQCLVEKDIPSIYTEIELPSGKNVEAYFLHPRPPVPHESKDSRERDAELLIVGKEVRDSQNPIIVAGDLNDVAWSETTTLFQKVSKLLDPRIGRGFYNTFHAKYFFLRWPLDHIFHSNHFELIKLERLPGFNSDHFPVYIKLSYQPEAKFQQVSPDADNKEMKDANKKIKEGVNDKE